MRDRLIELICDSIQTSECVCHCNHPYCNECNKLADYLLANGVIVPPCKVGDMVYRVVTMGTGVTFKKVGYNTYKQKEQTIKRFIRCIEVTKNNFLDVCEYFGKTVFLTREEAEAKLKGEKQ